MLRKRTLRNLFIVLLKGNLKLIKHATLSFNECIESEQRSQILQILRFPDREKVFRRALELKDEIDVKLYADYPREIQERRRKL